MSISNTQSTLLTMGMDAASAHPELIVNTKTGNNTMKRRFDTVAARRAFGRSDILAQAHLSKAMARLAQQGIYLPMSKEMLQGEIKATAGISKLEEDDAAVGRLSLTPMGEFSYQRKEIAEGEDWEANKPSYNYNQGVLTKLKKRIHRIGKKHPSQAKKDVKDVLKERQALEDEYAEIVDELIKSNYYLDTNDTDDGSDGTSSSGGGSDPFHPPRGGGGGGGASIHIPLNLGGSVSTGGLSTPTHGFGGDGPSSGGPGPQGNVVLDTGNNMSGNNMVVDPGNDAMSDIGSMYSFKSFSSASGLSAKTRAIITDPYGDNESVYSFKSFGTPSVTASASSGGTSAGSEYSFISSRSKGSGSSRSSTMSRISSMHFAGQPQSTVQTGINLSGKSTGQPVNMNNVTNTTINATNNSSANEAFRSTKTLAIDEAAQKSFTTEAAKNTSTTVRNQEFAPLILGRGLLADNTVQRESITIAPEAVSDRNSMFLMDDFHLDFEQYGGKVSFMKTQPYLPFDSEVLHNAFVKSLNEHVPDEKGRLTHAGVGYFNSFNPHLHDNAIPLPKGIKDPNAVQNMIEEEVRAFMDNDPTVSPVKEYLQKNVGIKASTMDEYIENVAQTINSYLHHSNQGFIAADRGNEELRARSFKIALSYRKMLFFDLVNKFGMRHDDAQILIGKMLQRVYDSINNEAVSVGPITKNPIFKARWAAAIPVNKK